MAIPNMDTIVPFEIEPFEVNPYITDVSIFNSTPAVEIPNKLNAVALDFKHWNNEEIGVKGSEYINSGTATSVEFLNNSISAMTSYVNTVVVDNQNTFISQSTENYENFTSQSTENYENFTSQSTENYENFTSESTENYENFTSEMQNNIGSYLSDSGAGYSISQANSLSFSGNSVTEYDIENRVIRYVNGAKETYDITYEDDNVVAFKEKITIDSATYEKEFNVSYDANENPTISEVV